jgi:hypothetical protein
MEEVEGEVSEKSLRNGGNHGFLVPVKAVLRTTGSLALEPMQKDRERRQLALYCRRRESKMEIPVYAHLAHPRPELPDFVHQGLRVEHPIQQSSLDPERSYRV